MAHHYIQRKSDGLFYKNNGRGYLDKWVKEMYACRPIMTRHGVLQTRLFYSIPWRIAESMGFKWVERMSTPMKRIRKAANDAAWEEISKDYDIVVVHHG